MNYNAGSTLVIFRSHGMMLTLEVSIFLMWNNYRYQALLVQPIHQEGVAWVIMPVEEHPGYLLISLINGQPANRGAKVLVNTLNTSTPR